MAAGDPVTRQAGSEGVAMIEGHPEEPVGPEDAAGPGPKRGDYSDRGDGKAHHYEYVRDQDGNMVPRDQVAAMNETPAVGDAGEKGGVNTGPSGQYAQAPEGAVTDPNEVVTLTVDATGGTYTLTLGADTTGAIAFDATAAALETELEALTTVGAGNVSVSGGPGNAGGTTPYTIEFVGDLASTDVGAITVDDALLTGGGATATVEVTQAGG